ncbi:MAG: aminoacyl-tRNA hydrolase [Clostridia bacterium]|nr:aminoacyl-tRNA hydrolase [Clostridia bacterium]
MSIFDIFRSLEKERRSSGPPQFIVAGLGNPGPRYENTRHNTGFLAIDYIAEKLSAEIIRSKFKALCGDVSIGETRVLLMKPQTFMNSSGDAVLAASEFYRIAPEKIIVISDDLALPAGRVRLRFKGSSGGQNGLGDIAEKLGTECFPRIRIGIGSPAHAGYDTVDYVLGVPSPDDREAIESVFPKVFNAVEMICRGENELAMSRTNGQQ